MTAYTVPVGMRNVLLALARHDVREVTTDYGHTAVLATVEFYARDWPGGHDPDRVRRAWANLVDAVELLDRIDAGDWPAAVREHLGIENPCAADADALADGASVDRDDALAALLDPVRAHSPVTCQRHTACRAARRYTTGVAA